MTRRSLDELAESPRRTCGWLARPIKGEVVPGAAATRPGDQIVEIGSFRGRSTIVLAGGPGRSRGRGNRSACRNDRGPQEITGLPRKADDHEVFNVNPSPVVTDRVRMYERSATRHTGPSSRDRGLVHRWRASLLAARSDIRQWGGRASWMARCYPRLVLICRRHVCDWRELVLGRRFRYVGRSRSLSEQYRDCPTFDTRGQRRQVAQLPWFVKNVAPSSFADIAPAPPSSVRPVANRSGLTRPVRC
jgi:hypothetical protein